MTKLSDNAESIFSKRYALHENESWEDACRRVGRVVANAETTDVCKYKEDFAEVINDMFFLPGGRILRNAGRPRGSLFNCYVLPVGDSREEIGQWFRDSLILWGEGGGVGCNLSALRPHGAPIKGVGGVSSGPVSFLEASDAVANTIESGGSRRAAALATLVVSHPDIMEFIDAKMVHGKLSHYNISVAVTEEFIEAVEKDEDWEFKFNQQPQGKIKAREIWDKIMDNMITHAEPGLLNWDNLRSNNSYYYSPISATNPCVVGDTLIAVADGRNYVSIKQLADENKDVPVFSLNEVTKKMEVKMMRNPRWTGKCKVYKLTLDDGSFTKVTGNHKFYMKDGSCKETQDLVCGDSLDHMVKYHASFEEIFNKFNSKSQDYVWLNNGFQKTVSEHRLIGEFFVGRPLENGEVVHHIDRDALNNDPCNLEIMSKEKHDDLHSLDMLGQSNPMNRFPDKNWLIKQDWSGENNGRYKGYSPDSIFEIAVNVSKSYGRCLTKDEWHSYCLENKLPYSKYSYGDFSNFESMLSAAAEAAGVFSHKGNSALAREYKRYLDLKQESDLHLFFDGSIKVRKYCEHCGTVLTLPYGSREVCFCSVRCAYRSERAKSRRKEVLKSKQLVTREKQIDIFRSLSKLLGRLPLKKEWQKSCSENGVSHRIRTNGEAAYNEYCFSSYEEVKESAVLNFKVVSVEFIGYEDVYNGTVDDNHNFYTMVGQSVTRSGKIKYNHLLNRQCGEVPLSGYECCDLGSLVLPKFITGNINTNWKKLEQVIHLAIRFLDNIIDINKYVLPEIDRNAHLGRRIGLGVMGLAEYLFAKKLRYGSSKANDEVERLMKFIRDTSYEASVKLAEERGAFPKFDPVQYGKAHFVRTLPAALRMAIKDKGIRNTTLNAVAPTGTISLLAEVSSSIEPLFLKAYERHDRISERLYVHPMFKELVLQGIDEMPDWFVDTADLSPSDHFEVQAAIQKYTDGAVSKTINMPAGSTSEELSRLTLEYIHDLKGVTVYVDGSREGQILNKVDLTKVKSCIINNKEGLNGEEIAQNGCRNGKCDL
jgi:ribonucleotide reductase alpha subunit